jgi:uncharacterized peroxidase-related enzyme
MTRLKALDPELVTGKTKELFNAIHGKLGIVPNMMRTMGNSPTLLEGCLNLSGALGGGTLGAKTGELIAIAVAESNSCHYCLAAHTYVGINLLKIDAGTIEEAKKGNSPDVKTDKILKFAKLLVDNRGLVSDEDVDSLKTTGISEGEIAEIIGHVGLSMLTNYFNNVAKTESDFPA